MRRYLVLLPPAALFVGSHEPDSAVDLAVVLTLVALLVFSDLSRRQVVAARRELARRGEQLAYAQEAGRIGSWEIAADGTEAWSSSFREMLGVAPEVEASTDLFHALLHPDGREAAIAADRAMLGEEGDHEFEYRIVRPDGAVRWMLARGRCLCDRDGKRRRVHGVAIDITERKSEETERTRLEQQLTQALKLETIGQLAGGIAHDFNNLLTGIGGYVELASDRIADGASPRAELAEISAAVGRATALTRQLLAFSRKQVLSAEVLDLNDVVRSAEGLLERVLGENVRLDHVARRERVLVEGDRTQLEQVLLNLAVNARDAMPDGGSITIEVDEVDVEADHTLDLEPGRFALLSVSDTGCGIDAETAARIFEPFFTTKENGTGLGLATVHGIVTQSGGTIWVYGEPGRGTTFKLYLPLAAGELQRVESAATPPSQDGRGEHVLVVEDDRQVRAIIKQMLVRRGFVVTVAGNAVDAIAAARADRIDLVLSDLVMPGKGGRELVAELRELQPRAAVLYMSGYSDDAVKRRGVIEAGTAFIEKPFSSDDLVVQLRSLLDAA